MRNELSKISIITPCYNKGEFIEETIECVRNQNYPFIEHIVVDGGSRINVLISLSIMNSFLTFEMDL